MKISKRSLTMEIRVPITLSCPKGKLRLLSMKQARKLMTLTLVIMYSSLRSWIRALASENLLSSTTIRGQQPSKHLVNVNAAALMAPFSKGSSCSQASRREVFKLAF